MSLLGLTVAVPFILKVSSTGYVQQEWKRTEKCEVFENQVTLTRTFSHRKVEFQIPFSSEQTLQELIDLARKEQILEEENYLCDGPVTIIKAQDVLLYTTGGCGIPSKKRTGPYSSALVDIAGTFCPTTH